MRDRDMPRQGIDATYDPRYDGSTRSASLAAQNANIELANKPSPTQAVLNQLRNLRGANNRLMDMLEGVTKKMTGVSVLPPPGPSQTTPEGMPFFEHAEQILCEIRIQQENLFALAEHLEKI